jgi:ureidoacrylate peracid hydrolase
VDILRTLRERCDPKNAALIVVDVQNDFVHPDGSAGKRGEDVSAALAMVPNLLRVQTVSQSDGSRSSFAAGGHQPSCDDENRVVNRGLRAISG